MTRQSTKAYVLRHLLEGGPPHAAAGRLLA